MEPAPADGSMSERLDELLELTRENNKLLKAMKRDALIGGVVKTVIWIVLVVASFYLSAKFLEPYLGMMQAGEPGEGAGSMQELIEQYKDLLGQ